jgi:1-deoxy-D-xylulose-5-phosphate reductoisomerase|tara:strand:+ start:156 stop:1319 length:1164 start_codon:yes stop_codon:yes gene_type:complete
MKKKISILGSTGSIGTTLLNIINNDKKNFDILLLTANKDYLTLLKQAKNFNVKNLIINDINNYKILKKKCKNLKIKVYNNFDRLDKIFRKKNDYVMSSITGIEGLIPTINIIKFTKQIAIANKESIICGWNLIKKELEKNKTKFIPVDSEHFSIWYALKNISTQSINKIYLTASGGPLNELSKTEIKNIKISQTLNHPNWKMGKKISIDSATLMNKIFEIIEAKNIFNISYKKLDILIHPKSYIHAIIKFNDGLIKIVAHDTTMKIPIFNTLYLNTGKILKTKKLNTDILNDLRLKKVDHKKFPLANIIPFLPENFSLFETVIVSANDELVDLYLKKKIKFNEISTKLMKLIKLKEFNKFKKISPKNIESIMKLNEYVRLKVNSKSI